MNRSFLVSFAAFALAISTCHAGIPIPNTPYGIHQGDSNAQVVLSVFGDLMCPDTKQAYPTLLEVAAHYGSSRVRFVFHPFALPYTHNSFYANQGVYVVRQATQNMTKVWDFINVGFANQHLFWNHLTMDKTPNQVIAQWGGIVEAAGILSQAEYVKGIANITTYMAADFAWKYGASRAVSGTPTFYVNDVTVDAATTWTVNDWRQVIDPLFGITPPVSVEKSPFAPPVCPSGDKSCEYLPNKFECCSASEYCIRNVGCTC